MTGHCALLILLLRYTHAASASDAVPESQGFVEVKGGCSTGALLKGLNISEAHFHQYNRNYPSH